MAYEAKMKTLGSAALSGDKCCTQHSTLEKKNEKSFMGILDIFLSTFPFQQIKC